MKTINKTLLIICIVIVVLILISLILPSKMTVEKSLVIKAPAELIYNQVNVLKNWEKWSPWHKIDTLMKIEYFGGDSGVGTGYTWKSDNKKVGNGKLSIIETVKDTKIITEMTFMEQKDNLPTIGFFFEKADSGTRVSWAMENKLGWNPIDRFIGIIMKKMVGKDFEKGLKSLKEISEYLVQNPEYKIVLEDVKAFCYIGIRDTCTYATIGQKMGMQFGQLMEYAAKNKAIEVSPPIAVYYKFENGIFDMESGIPIDKCLKSEGKIKCIDVKDCKAAVAFYYGPYDKMEKAYKQLENWIKTNKKTISGAPWEEYVTDPTTEKDPSKWLTKIYFPVE
jgi:effector-binding domain-containing protein